MTLDAFWELIESAWSEHPALLKKRETALAKNNPMAIATLADDIEDTIFDDFQDLLYELTREDLVGFIHTLEERLYNLDRKAIHEATESNDESFVYARCFIIAVGRAYYDAVDADPSKAVPDAEAEGFGFTAYSVFADRFDEDFKPNSSHNIGTRSNKAGWS